MSNNVKILIVDDEWINRYLLITIIKKEFDVTIDEAENGKEAIEFVERNQYDIIFMDIRMPVMDGVEAVRIIKEEIKSLTPIVVVSAYHIDDIMQIHKDLNPDINICPKPININCISKIIEEQTGKMRIKCK